MMQENKKNVKKYYYHEKHNPALDIGNHNRKREELISPVSSGNVQSVNFGNLLRGYTFSTVAIFKSSYNLVQEIKRKNTSFLIYSLMSKHKL